MDFNEVIQKRHSTRFFSDEPIPTEILTAIVAESTRIPSWLDAQEHRIYIATGETLKKIHDEYKARAAEGLIGVSDLTAVHRNEWSESAQKNMANFSSKIEKYLGNEFKTFVEVQDTLFNAPALVFLTLPKNSCDWAIVDLGALEYAILLSAANRGIGSIVAYAITKYPDIIRKHLGISENDKVALGIALGYEDQSQKINKFRSDRMLLSDILTIKK